MEYAMLQVYLPHTSQDALIRAMERHMAANGMAPCVREAAERTAAIAPDASGWAVYDDCADRMDLSILDSLGRALTRRSRGEADVPAAVGVLVSGERRMVRLYAGGRVRDTLLLNPRSARHPVNLTDLARARRWRPILSEKEALRDFASVLAEGGSAEKAGALLRLDRAASYGFRSLELEQPEGLILLPFCSQTTVKQKLSDRLFGLIRRPDSAAGACLRRRDSP